MFKYTSKLASSQRKCQQALSKIHINHKGFGKNTFQIRAFGSHQRQFIQDFSQIKPQQYINDSSNKSQYLKKIDDYEVDPSYYMQKRKLEFTHEELSHKHPTEYFIHKEREKKNVYSTIKPNELLLVNLPINTTEQQIKELCTTKDVEIMGMEMINGCQNFLSYTRIIVQSPKEVKLLKDYLKNKWIEDRQIKVRLAEDQITETYDKRTIIVQGIPNSFNEFDLYESFGEFGIIVGIELPTQDQLLQKEIEKQGKDIYSKQQKAKDERIAKRAEQSVKNSLEVDQQYQKFLLEHFSKEQADQTIANAYEDNQDISLSDALDSQKYESLSKMITQLQSEGVEVQSAMKSFIQLKNDINSFSQPSATIQDAIDPQIQQQMQENKDNIKRVLKYLKENKDTKSNIELPQNINVSQEISFDNNFQCLQKLSRGELSIAYDILIQQLKEREVIIENRIKDSINFLGKEERILFEVKDFDKDLEELPNMNDIFDDSAKIEDVLSINEQVRNIILHKNKTPEERYYHLLKKTYNPFVEANFNTAQLAGAQTTEMNNVRQLSYPSQDMPPTMARLLHGSKPFYKKTENLIQDKVKQLRNRMDLPFDELYHKEKVLVDNVIKAQKALLKKEESLPNPYGKIFVQTDLSNQNDSDYEYEHQFHRDIKNKCINTQPFKLLLIENDLTNQFYIDEQNETRKLLDTGVLSQKDYDRLKILQKEQRMINEGYAFITYSHADEAKLSLIMFQEAMIDGARIEVQAKINVDHKDFDKKYVQNKMKNDAQLIDEMQKLREAKEELREFEKNIDKDLPSLKKLNEFREQSRNFIEDKEWVIRQYKGEKRTQEEEQQLNRKIKELQKENPNIDYTQLFDTPRAEEARKAQHKKAFASYKAYQFLKHGIEFQKKTQPEEKPQETPNDFLDPYNFPPLEKTVARLLTNDKFLKVLDSGDSIDKPGRRFSYTEQDFVEAYMGKDWARAPNLGTEQNQVFGFQDNLKHKYQIDKYLQLPILDKKKQQLEDFIDFEKLKLNDPDSPFAKFMQDFEPHEQINFVDRQHPTDPNRSLIKDAEAKLNQYIAKKESRGDPLFTGDIGKIRKELRDDYIPKEERPKRQKTRRRRYNKQGSKFEPSKEGEDSKQSEVIIEQPQKQEHQQRSRFDKRRDDKPPKKMSFSKQKQTTEKLQTINSKLDGFQVNEELSQLNKEIVYHYKDVKEKDPNEEIDIKFIKSVEKVAELNKLTPQQMLEQLKDQVSITDRANLGGDFYEDFKFGIKQEQLNNRETHKQGNLREFVKDTESEREDEDILSHYYQKMQEAKQNKEQNEKLNKEQKLVKEKMDDILPELPNFDGFYRSMSENKHPLEDDKFKFQDEGSEARHQEEQQQDEELYQRELQSRFYGEKLTPRQFALLYKVKTDEGTVIKLMKDQEREEYVNNRDIARLVEEKVEQYRRRQVLDGLWTEEESKIKIKEYVKQSQESIPNDTDLKKQRREFQEAHDILFQIQHPDRLFEKEYYFDEGLGESLQEHTQKLKKDFEDLDVQVRRDRDGFAIVKTCFKPKFKYNLDEISNFDPDHYNENMKETFEAILKKVLPKGGINSLTKEQIEQMVLMMNSQNQKKKYELDEPSKQALDNLVKQRQFGKYKDNVDGFVNELLTFSQKATYDKTKIAKSNNSIFGADDNTSNEAYEELYRERHLMAAELFQQLSMKIKGHMFMKARKPSDFVKGRKSELNVFASQMGSHQAAMDHLEKKYNQIVKDGQQQEEKGFDKEAFQQLKAEIKSRREAKEHLLQQGFPDFKPYVHI